MRTLRTRQLVLEPLVAAHAEEMFSVLSDPLIYEFENEAPSSAEWLRNRYRKLETRQSADGNEQWLNWVVRIHGAALIGYVQATVFRNSTALVAFEFNSAYWGKGLAREAVEVLLQELAESYGVTAAGAVYKRNNSRSRKLLDRLEMNIADSASFPRGLASQDEEAMVKNLQPN